MYIQSMSHVCASLRLTCRLVSWSCAFCWRPGRAWWAWRKWRDRTANPTLESHWTEARSTPWARTPSTGSSVNCRCVHSFNWVHQIKGNTTTAEKEHTNKILHIHILIAQIPHGRSLYQDVETLTWSCLIFWGFLVNKQKLKNTTRSRKSCLI